MISTTRTDKRYDYRLRDLVCSAGDISHATRLGVPRSTAQGWLASRPSEVVTVEVANIDLIALQGEVLVLKTRIDWLVAVLRLMVVPLKVTGISRDYARVSDGDLKALLLRAIERSRTVLPLRTVLRVLRISRSRYHSWKREEECGLEDLQSCQRSSPQELTSTVDSGMHKRLLAQTDICFPTHSSNHGGDRSNTSGCSYVHSILSIDSRS